MKVVVFNDEQTWEDAVMKINSNDNKYIFDTGPDIYQDNMDDHSWLVYPEH